MHDVNKASVPGIHPSVIVEPGAAIGEGVKIGPFCQIGPEAVIGNRVEVMAHVVIVGDTTIGDDCRIFPHAVLGTEPQNVAYKGEHTKLIIGTNNTIREGVTMHAGTGNARGETTVGDNCMFLAYSHVAHDCVIGDHVVFSNNVMIGGHTVIGDRVIVGGGAGIHQFCHIGHHAFIGGLAAVECDVIPYGMAIGNRAFMAGLNLVGMKRSGMARDDIHALRHAYQELFAENDKTLRENAQLVLDRYPDNPSVQDVAGFVLTSTKRKFVTPLSGRKSRQEPVI
jgi:UDP-N-acetylglucosamine acyltransferase